MLVKTGLLGSVWQIDPEGQLDLVLEMGSLAGESDIESAIEEMIFGG